jgi:hypothetical protein
MRIIAVRTRIDEAVEDLGYTMFGLEWTIRA